MNENNRLLGDVMMKFYIGSTEDLVRQDGLIRIQFELSQRECVFIWVQEKTVQYHMLKKTEQHFINSAASRSVIHSSPLNKTRRVSVLITSYWAMWPCLQIKQKKYLSHVVIILITIITYFLENRHRFFIDTPVTSRFNTRIISLA